MGMVTAITLFWSNKPNPAIPDYRGGGASEARPGVKKRPRRPTKGAPAPQTARPGRGRSRPARAPWPKNCLFPLVQAAEDDFGCGVDSLLDRCGVPAACDVFADLIEQADRKVSRKVSLLVNELADDQAAAISMWCASDEISRR